MMMAEQPRTLLVKELANVTVKSSDRDDDAIESVCFIKSTMVAAASSSRLCGSSVLVNALIQHHLKGGGCHR
jgi:hypothetical protein